MSLQYVGAIGWAQNEGPSLLWNSPPQDAHLAPPSLVTFQHQVKKELFMRAFIPPPALSGFVQLVFSILFSFIVGFSCILCAVSHLQ